MILKYLLEKEFKQFFRNAFLPRLVVVFPVMVMLVVPWITTMDIKDIRIAVVDHDRSSASRQLIRDIDASSYFLMEEITDNYSDALRKIEYGTTDAIVEIPAGFEKDLITIGTTPVQISINTVNGTKGTLGGSYLNAVMTRYSQRFFAENQPVFAMPSGYPLSPQMAPPQPPRTTPYVTMSTAVQTPSTFPFASQPSALSSVSLPSVFLPASLLPDFSSSPRIELITQNRYNPLLDYKLFMIPALMVILLIVMCAFLPTLNIVSEKERGTIEQMNVTPVSKFMFITAKLIPYWVMGILILSVCMALAYLVYGLYPKGSLLIIYLFSFLFILAMSGFGLVISNYSNTMQQAMFVMFFFVMIFQLMSGLLTPIRSMPDWAQWITIFNPPRYFIQMMRLVYLKGGGLADLSVEFFALLGFVLFFNLWAIVSYRKRG